MRLRPLAIVLFIACLIRAASACAAAPPKDPIFRIETGVHTAKISSIASDSSGRWLVTASADKTVRVWEQPGARPVRTIRPPIGAGEEGVLLGVAISPDGDTIACGGYTKLGSDKGSTIYLFNRANGNMTGRITGLRSNVFHLEFSPDGRYLASAVGSGVCLYRTSDWSPAGEDKGYRDSCPSVHFSRDGRLVTASLDGYLRLYEVADGKLRQTAVREGGGIGRPMSARFSPDGSMVAVGYVGAAKVAVLSGRDLSPLFLPDTRGEKIQSFARVAWSADGRYLFAGGINPTQAAVRSNAIRSWSDAGRGGYTETAVANNTILGLVPLPDGRIAYCAGDPGFGILDLTGKEPLFVEPASADFRDYRNYQSGFRVSNDGKVVSFSYQEKGRSPVSFDLSTRSLTRVKTPAAPPEEPGLGSKVWGKISDLLDAPSTSKPSQAESSNFLRLPRTSGAGLVIKGWDNTPHPVLNGKPLKLDKEEASISLAIAPNGTSFILGTSSHLRLFDRAGREIWMLRAPGAAWTVNLSGDGSVALAAFGDGTIRWYRMSDGKELLALFPHADKKRWVLWTPEGFFDHSPGGESLIGYHLNRGRDREAEFIPVSKLYDIFYRPDLIEAAMAGKDLSEYAKAIDINRLLSATTLPPKARFLTLSGSSETPETEVSAELCDGGGGIGETTLYLNDTPIAVESGARGLKVTGKGGDGDCYRFSRMVSLENGANVISLMAYNKDHTVESNRDSITVKHASRFTGKPDLHILTVSIDKYRDADLRLKYSNADAASVGDAVASRGKELFGTVHRYNLSDGEVTREKLEEIFSEIGKKTRREDLFILFVAGHGITYSKEGSFYFLPASFRYTQDEDIRQQGVSMNDFKRYLAYIQATKSLLLLDTCNSGSFADAIASRGITEKTAINKLTRAVGRATLVASSKGQVALEGFEGHGAFSWVLIDGIKGKAADPKGKITVNSLVSFVESTLPELTYKKWGYEQIPQKSLVGEDFQIGVR